MSGALKHLTTPIDVGPFQLRNRIISTAHTTVYNPDGLVGDQEIAYHVSKARGGIALSVTGSTTVHPSGGAPQMHLLVNFDDAVIPGYRRLGEARGARQAYDALRREACSARTEMRPALARARATRVPRRAGT